MLSLTRIGIPCNSLSTVFKQILDQRRFRSTLKPGTYSFRTQVIKFSRNFEKLLLSRRFILHRPKLQSRLIVLLDALLS